MSPTAADLLRSAMIRNRFNQKELAAAIGVTGTAVTEWLRYGRQPQPRYAARIAELAGVELSYGRFAHGPHLLDGLPGGLYANLRSWEGRMPLGETISAARKKLGYSQKELAGRLMKDEGGAISAQYLNDIEHDRRQPSSESLLRRLAEVLEIPIEVLLYQVGQLPADVRGQNASAERIQAAYQAFRRNIEG